MASASIEAVWGYRVELDGAPIYFGIGREGRWNHVTRDWCHNRPLRNTCRKHGDKIRVLTTDRAFATRADAQEWERDMIVFFGRRDLGQGVLFNFTDGGDGLSSADATAENLRRIANGSHQMIGDRNPMRRRKAAGIRHHTQDWLPWDRPQTTAASADTWAMAAELHRFFLEHRHMQRVPYRRHFRIPSRDALKAIAQRLRSGWEPALDLDWREWARAYRATTQTGDLPNGTDPSGPKELQPVR